MYTIHSDNSKFYVSQHTLEKLQNIVNSEHCYVNDRNIYVDIDSESIQYIISLARNYKHNSKIEDKVELDIKRFNLDFSTDPKTDDTIVNKIVYDKINDDMFADLCTPYTNNDSNNNNTIKEITLDTSVYENKFVEFDDISDILVVDEEEKKDFESTIQNYINYNIDGLEHTVNDTVSLDSINDGGNFDANSNTNDDMGYDGDNKYSLCIPLDSINNSDPFEFINMISNDPNIIGYINKLAHQSIKNNVDTDSDNDENIE